MREQELLDNVISTLDEPRNVWQGFLEAIISYFRPVSIMEPINPFHAKLKDKDIRYRAKMLGLFICLCDQFPDEVVFEILYDNKTKRKIKTMKLTMKNINELIFL